MFCNQGDVTLKFRNPDSKKEFLHIQALIECGFNLKRVRDEIKTDCQIHRTCKKFQQRSMIWPVRLNGWVLNSKLSSCGFKSSCRNLNFRFHAWTNQGVAWHSANDRVWIDSETRTRHDQNTKTNVPHRQLLATQLNHLTSLAKWLSVLLWPKWLWIQVHF